MEPWGFLNALHYTVFGVILSYAVHGWVMTHVSPQYKVQSSKEYEVSPQAMAVRSTAAILTSMVYTFLPLAPGSTSITQFVTWTFVFALYWDLHFYVAHRYAHENKWAYRFFHKTHHLCKQPNCFGAYFVTYQSHVLLEQIVVIVAAMAGLPKDVFMFSLYWGTLGTYLEHCGYELGDIQLPFIPITFGRLCSFISFPGLVFDGKMKTRWIVVVVTDVLAWHLSLSHPPTHVPF
jgi:sterol desaturase/sphingolipid hydroxylase (fatty acid hydroxylase superfamily)